MKRLKKIRNERKLTPREEFEYLLYRTQGQRTDQRVTDGFGDAAARVITSWEAKPPTVGA